VPWLTVVTVVKDDPQGFERTLKSLDQQDLDGIEFVVVDSSNDSETIPKVLSEVLFSNSHVTWTEPSGIYSAMNTGLRQAQGDYIYFLNAGDAFCDENVLREIWAIVESVKPVWIVGRVEIFERSGATVPSRSWDYQAEKKALFARGLFPPHQGTIVRTEALRSVGGFNGQFAIAADYAAALSLSQVSTPHMTDRLIATFFEGGVSTERWQESFREFHRARRLILTPRGFDSLVERFNYGKHYASVWLIRRLRRG
jgi:glycosyltransferase involved in cell wall biosynthesis